MKITITMMASIMVLSGVYIFSANAAEKIQATIKVSALSVSNINTPHPNSVTKRLKTHTQKNLQLQASIPGNLNIADKRIHWTISPKGEPVLKTLSGNTRSLDLPEGMYTVKLSIGKFTTKQDVAVYRGQQIQPYFKAELASLSLRSNQVVDWLLTGSGGHQFIIKQKSRLKQLLPAGDYTVQAVLRNMPLQKQIRLKTGQAVKNEINIPVGQIKLIATKENQPLFKPVSWKVFRLNNERRHEVGKYHLHSQLISIPPGHYEAVAEQNGKLRKRQFWVQPNTVNNIVLAMD